MCESGGSHNGIDHDSSLLRYEAVLISKCLRNLRRVKQSNKAFIVLLRREDGAINLLPKSANNYQSALRHITEDLNLFADPLLSGAHTR